MKPMIINNINCYLFDRDNFHKCSITFVASLIFNFYQCYTNIDYLYI